MAVGVARSDQVSARDGTVDIVNAQAEGVILIVCEHASNAIPAEYGNLGLDEAALASHIAWDPGALGVADEMARRLDAPLVVQRVSRLLYDCNRPPDSDSAVPETSEIYGIPGNAGLSAQARRARVERYYVPFRSALAETIQGRLAQGRLSALVTVHSFTPVFHGSARTVEIGILHDTDSRLADAMLETASAETSMVVRRNEPYGPQDGVTHTLREHALPRGLANVMIEIRNDLVGDAASQAAIGALLAGWLERALDRMAQTAPDHGELHPRARGDAR